MGPTWTIAGKDLKILWRDKMAIFWVLGFPLVIAIMFGSIFGGGGAASKMKIAVDDQDHTSVSKQFVDKLKSSDSLEVSSETFDAAKDEVRKGDKVAVIVVPKGYGTHSVFSGQQPAIEVGIDPSRKAEAGILQGLLAQASFAPLQKLFTDPGAAKTEMQQSLADVERSSLDPEQKKSLRSFLGAADKYFSMAPAGPNQNVGGGFSGPKIKNVPIQKADNEPKSSFDLTFPEGVVWALVGVSMAFAIGIVRERADGTFFRLQVAPVSRLQLILGKGIACFISCVMVISVLMLVGKLFFGLDINNLPLIAFAILCSSFCFVGVVMTLSVLGKSEQAVSGSGRAFLILASMFGGGMIPLAIMPPWMQTASSFSPAKWAVLSLEGSIWRGFSWTEMMLPCGILIAIGVVGIAVGATVLSRTAE